MVRPTEPVLRDHDIGWWRAALELLLGRDRVEKKMGDVDAPHLVTGRLGAGGISVGEGVAEMTAGTVGMTLYDQDFMRGHMPKPNPRRDCAH